MSLPYFLIYGGDLQKHSGYRRASREVRGAYLDFLLLANEGSERGVMIFSGEPLTLEEVAGAIGGDYQGAVKAIEELIRLGLVAVRKDGALLSPELVAQEKERQETAKRKRNQRARDAAGFPPDNEPDKSHGQCHTDVTPMSHLSSSSSSLNSSSNDELAEVVDLAEHKAKAEKPVNRPVDPLFAYFSQQFLKHYGVPFDGAQKDFVQFASLKRKCLKHNWELTPARWEQAVNNYFASELGKHTLAHLSADFKFYFHSPLDRYGKPIAGHASKPAAPSTPKQSGVDVPDWYKEIYQQ